MAKSQSEIFARYRSLFNSSSVQPTDSPTSKRIDNLNFVDFLFEIVKATKGQNGFKNVILKGVLSDVKQKKQINDTIKNSLISIFGCDQNLIIPGKYTTDSVNGIPMTKTEIDSFGLLKFDPKTSVGKLMFEGNDITKHVNYFIHEAQLVNESSPIVFKYNNNDLFSLYSKDSGTFIFKFGSYYKNKQYSLWLNDYLNVCDPIFNFANFSAILTDLISGSLSLGGNKSKLEINQNSSTISALKGIFGFCNEGNGDNGDTNGSMAGYLNNQNNLMGSNINNNGNNNGNGNNNLNDIANGANNFFSFNTSELNDINNDADAKANGFIKFSTCGDLEVPINSDDIISQLDSLFNNSDVTQIIDYGANGNSFDPSNGTTNNTGLSNTGNLTDGGFDNTKKDPNLNNLTDFLSSMMNPGIQSLLNIGEDALALDLNNIQTEHQLNILKSIPYAIMQMVLSPKILIIPKTHSYLNNDVTSKDSQAVINSLSKLIYNIGEQITKKILTNIFNSIKSDLIKLTKDLAGNFLKQRGMDYLACLTSLLSLLGLLGSLLQDSGCQSILDKLLKLLKLANFGPMPPIPPPLVLIGGALKPGLNQVAMVNDIKASLQAKGIETAPTMPDGTPNNMMIAIEETVKTLITHIKTNANISVTTTGVGLTQGYGQIQ